MRLNKHQKFAKAIVENGSVKAAGKACKISPSTAYRWSKKPEVKEAVTNMRKAKMSALSAYMTKASKTATETIMKLIKDDSISAQVRLQASMFVIKMGYDRLDVDDLEKRIEKLEMMTKNR